MNLFKDFKPEINVPDPEYYRLLGYPSGYKPEGKSAVLTAWARDWYKQHGRPWIYGLMINEVHVQGNAVMIQDLKFVSEKLARQFYRAGTSKAVAAVLSAGKECEEKAWELWNENKPDEYFFLEIYGSAVVEHLVSAVSYFLCSWAEENMLGILPHYSPGYTGWKIEDQHLLWNLVKNNKAEFPGEIELFESGMLKPKKSLLALFGITANRDGLQNITSMIPCSNCTFNSCRYRRLPYKKWRSRPQKNIRGNELRYEN